MGTFVESAGGGLAPVIVASNRVNGVVSAGIASLLNYSQGWDGSFLAIINCNCTAFTSGSLSVQVNYNNEANVAQNPSVQGHFTSGYTSAITGTGSFEGQPLHIRVKGGTTIIFSTVSAAFIGTYNVEAYLLKMG